MKTELKKENLEQCLAGLIVLAKSQPDPFVATSQLGETRNILVARLNKLKEPQPKEESDANPDYSD